MNEELGIRNEELRCKSFGFVSIQMAARRIFPIQGSPQGFRRNSQFLIPHFSFLIL